MSNWNKCIWHTLVRGCLFRTCLWVTVVLAVRDWAKALTKINLQLLLEDGTLVIYEATEDFGVSSFKDGSNATLSVRWVKRSTHALGMAKQVRAGGTDAVPSPANRLFVPFGDVGGYSGVFITGSNPYWLVKEDFGPARLFECGLSPVYGFTSIGSSHVISLGEVSTLAMLQKMCNPNYSHLILLQDIVIATLPENTHLHREQPFTKVVQNRTYTGLVFMDEMQCYAALSTFEAPFEIFDEEGKPIHPHDSEQALEPTGSRSALEVIEPGSWKTVDGLVHKLLLIRQRSAHAEASLPVMNSGSTRLPCQLPDVHWRPRVRARVRETLLLSEPSSQGAKTSLLKELWVDSLPGNAIFLLPLADATTITAVRV